MRLRRRDVATRHHSSATNRQGPQRAAPQALGDGDWQHKPIELWQLGDVLSWMSTLPMSKSYSQVVKRHRMDGKALLAAGVAGWRDKGITCFGDLRILESALQQAILETPGTPYGPPASIHRCSLKPPEVCPELHHPTQENCGEWSPE